MATRTINVTPETSGFATVALTGDAADVAFDPTDFDGTSTDVQAALESAWGSLIALGTAIGGPYQAESATLTSLAALATTTFGRSVLTQADAAALRTLAGLGTAATTASTAYQPVDADLTAIAALTTTPFGRGLLALVDAAAARTALGLGSLATLSTIASANITDGTIVDADINASAAIAQTKIAGLVTALSTKTLTATVTSPTGDPISTDNSGDVSIPIDATLNGKNLTAVSARVTTVSSSGAVTVQLVRLRAGSPTNMLSTALTIDASEPSSSTAATAAVIGTAGVQTDDQVRIDITGAGTGAKGLSVTMVYA